LPGPLFASLFEKEKEKGKSTPSPPLSQEESGSDMRLLYTFAPFKTHKSLLVSERAVVDRRLGCPKRKISAKKKYQYQIGKVKPGKQTLPRCGEREGKGRGGDGGLCLYTILNQEQAVVTRSVVERERPALGEDLIG